MLAENGYAWYSIYCMYQLVIIVTLAVVGFVTYLIVSHARKPEKEDASSKKTDDPVETKADVELKISAVADKLSKSGKVADNEAEPKTQTTILSKKKNISAEEEEEEEEEEDEETATAIRHRRQEVVIKQEQAPQSATTPSIQTVPPTPPAPQEPPPVPAKTVFTQQSKFTKTTATQKVEGVQQKVQQTQAHTQGQAQVFASGPAPALANSPFSDGQKQAARTVVSSAIAGKLQKEN